MSKSKMTHINRAMIRIQLLLEWAIRSMVAPPTTVAALWTTSAEFDAGTRVIGGVLLRGRRGRAGLARGSDALLASAHCDCEV